MPSSQTTSWFLLVVFLNQISTHCLADNEDGQQSSRGTRAESEADTATGEQPFFAFLDAPQQAVSSRLNQMASAMDAFFAEERAFYDNTGSYIRLTLDTIQAEGGEVGYQGDIKLKLRLPRTEERLKLTFESNPEEGRDDLDTALEETPVLAAEEKSYYAGIQATLGDERKWRFRPGFGVKFRQPLDVFVRLRADRSYRAGDWLFRPSQSIYAFKETGFGSDTSFVFDYQVSRRILFRSTSFIRYTDENDYYEPHQVFSLLHAISRRRGMAYQLGVYGITEPTWHATDYLARIRYRQNIHSDYLFLELIPSVLYERENDFDPEHTMTLRLEMVFSG